MYDLETIKAMEARAKIKEGLDQDKIINRYTGPDRYIGPEAAIIQIRSNSKILIAA